MNQIPLPGHGMTLPERIETSIALLRANNAVLAAAETAVVVVGTTRRP